jgi:hypothetical protein
MGALFSTNHHHNEYVSIDKIIEKTNNVKELSLESLISYNDSLTNSISLISNNKDTSFVDYLEKINNTRTKLLKEISNRNRINCQNINNVVNTNNDTSTTNSVRGIDEHNTALVPYEITTNRQSNQQIVVIKEKTTNMPQPKYNGSLLEWRPFIKTFSIWLNRQKVESDVDRFYLLKSSLENSKGLLENIPLIPGCYQVALDKLNETYNDPKEARSEIWRQIKE